jgi:Ca2+-binding RTX toxin-like protein
MAELLTGAQDPDGDKLAVQSFSAESGTLEQLGPESWLFTPMRDEAGPVNLHYQITDGKATVSQTAHSEFLARHGDDISGTDGDDVLIGTPLNDVIEARAGNDVVYGREGDDAIHGGAGNDRLIGGDGNDIIWGGPGNDVIFGGAGNDTLFGEEGNDTLFGEDGNDLLFGGTGDDVLVGGNGDDRLDGGAGADKLLGDAGNDVLDGGDGDDQLDGGAGNDVLLGGTGNDSLSGGDGNDQVFGDAGDDHLDGGAGDDHLDGGDGNDALLGGTGDDTLAGGAGNDVIDGGSGSNTIDGGRGDDVVRLSLTDGSDVIKGGEGKDTIDLQDIVFDSTVDLPDGLVSIDGVDRAQIFEIENIHGGHGRDHLIANDQVNIMVGGDGNDTFTFATLASVANNGGPRDHIMDFSSGDRLDLSRLGQELDEFAGRKLFFVEAGSARFDEIGAVTYRHEIVEGQEITVVSGNLDQDQEPEFEIVLDGHHDLTQADFILDVNTHHSDIQHPGQ